MKRIILLLIISFTFVFLSGCKNNNKNIDTPEKAVNEIISCYNNGDFNCMWQRVLPKDKYAVSQNIINNINNNDLFILMGYALNKDNLTSDNITSEEYFRGLNEVAAAIPPVKFTPSENAPENPVLDEVFKILNSYEALGSDVQNSDPASHMLDSVRNALQGLGMGNTPEECGKQIVERLNQ